MPRCQCVTGLGLRLDPQCECECERANKATLQNTVSVIMVEKHNQNEPVDLFKISQGKQDPSLNHHIMVERFGYLYDPRS